MGKWKQLARALKKQIMVLYYAYRDPRVPWYAKLAAVVVVAYACSPIDLIPDFIPILGYLDDLILVPLGIWLTLKLIPADIVKDIAHKVEQLAPRRPQNWLVGGLMIGLWMVLGIWLCLYIYTFFG